VIAVKKTTSLHDFIKRAFITAGINLRFKVEDVNEVGIIESIDPVKC